MSWSKVLVLALGAVLLGSSAFAQDDDDLMQLSPKKKVDPKAKLKPKAKPRPPVVKPPLSSTDDELAPLTPSKADLLLKLAGTAIPRRTRVSIDERDVGPLPVAPQSLSVGDHTVAVRAPGYATWTKKISIVANKPTEVTVGLEATSAIVSVTTDAPGAQVAINGKSVGLSPLEDLEVLPGTTTITVRKEGYRDSSQTLKLIPGKEYPLSIKLSLAPVAEVAPDRPEAPNLVPPANADLGLGTTVEPSAPVYTRWYFWVGTAAVIAAVAAGTAVGVSSSQPKPLGEKAICGDKGCDSCIGFTCMTSPASGIVPFKF